MTHPTDWWCIPDDPMDACTSAQTKCGGDLQISCEPDSSGGAIEKCSEPPPVVPPGVDASSCPPGQLSIFGAACMDQGSGIAIYVAIAAAMLVLLKICCRYCNKKARDADPFGATP